MNTVFSIPYNPSISSINLVSTELEKSGVTLICNPEFFSGNHWDVMFKKEIVAELIFNFYLNNYRFISTKKGDKLPEVVENFISQMNANATDEPLEAVNDRLEYIKATHLLTVANRSLREQTLDASAKILQHSLGNMMFRAEGLHPISDSTIHIQLDGSNDELDISFWPMLGAFNTNDPDKIDDKLCAALFHHGKIDGKKLLSVQLIRNVLYFTV